MMISRALLIALCIVYATSLTPIAPITAAADDDCALYLTGPGRSSAYDYSLNLLKGNFAYDGQHTCITYEAINQAYLDARTRILVSQPKGDWKAEDFASVGELILDISISLARTYGLTYEEIEKGLPLIDTSRTLIREACPPVFSHVECRAGKYRRLDGLCNNLKHPTWGSTMAPFQRLIGPLFSDGINAPRISHTGHDLPLSRVVSRTMHPDDGFHDHAGTVMVIAWGQFMDHDYTLTGTPLDPVNRNDPEECCKRPPHLKHPYCNEIRVPDDDYFYRLFGVKCIDFVRGFPSPRPGCRLGSRVPFNTLTGSLDGNTVYGVTEKFARKLRTGYGGLLRMNPVFKEYGLKDLLPLKLDIPDEGCTRPNKNMYCFEAGEIRVNEQLVLTVMHTLMAREHNRVAEALAQVNPHWDDESLFQEARRINIAEIQHITYNEFLPILLGKDVMEKFGLVLAKSGYWEGYDEEVNPDVIASFAAAAYRFGHSLLPTAVERWSKAHKFIASKRLSDLIRRPYDLYRAGVLDEYVMGLMNQVAQAMDDSITQEVTNHLFKKVGARFGMDLVSFNMQRGREFGLPGYMEFRKFCGLSGADTFQDLFGSMANETIRKYESIFEHPIDVDLWSGGVSERPLPGSMLGPTFACIIATQFSYSRRGDRFWFELPNQPSSFTPEQLAEIRKSRLARIICDNTDIIDTVQLYPMVLPDHELNPRVPCRSGIIPSMDFSKWADPVPYIGGAKEYMTNAYTSNQTTARNNQRDICDNVNESCGQISETINKISQIDNVNNTESVTSNDKKNGSLCVQSGNNTDCLNNIINCTLEQNCTDATLNPSKTLGKQVEENSVLKYITKKGDAVKVSEKLKGHFKNSLKRKRRSPNKNHKSKDKKKLPGIYYVINDQNIERGQLNLPKLDASEIIKSSDIADFKVETLHDKPEHSTFHTGEQTYDNPIGNNQYFSNSEDTQEPNNENEKYRDDRYGTFIKNLNIQENKNRGSYPKPQKLKQRYHDDVKKKHYLPKSRQLAEESAEINVRDDTDQKNSNYEDEIDDTNENYKRNERLNENTKAPNNILPKRNIRYYKNRNNKYHISKPKKRIAESNEDVSRENGNKHTEEEEDDNDDEDEDHIERFEEDERLNRNRQRSKTIPHHRTQGNHDGNIKHRDKDTFAHQEDENDEEQYEEPRENVKRQRNVQGRKLLSNKKLSRPNEKYNTHHTTPKKPNNYNDETEEREDIENEYDDNEDDEVPHENYKINKSYHKKDPSSNEKSNQQYKETPNNYFLADEDDDENLDERDDEDDEDYDSNENIKNNRDTHEHQPPPRHSMPKQNQVYINNKKRKYNSPVPKNNVKVSDDRNGRQEIEKENRYQEKEDVDEQNENFKNQRDFQKYAQPNKKVYYKENNKYPLLESEHAKSNKNFEREHIIDKENGYEEDKKEPIKNYKRNEGLDATRVTDSELENNKDDIKLKYINQPLPLNNGKISRPDIYVQSNIDNEKQHLLPTDEEVYSKNNNFNRSPQEHFRDNRLRETQNLNDNYNIKPKNQRKNKPKVIQEVDLSDFNYDRFREESDAENHEPPRASLANYDNGFLVIPSTNKPKLKKIYKSANIRQPQKFKKPVETHGSLIELNNENNSEESKKNSNESPNSNFERAIPHEPNGKTEVKQQFERIPSDYNAESNVTKSRPPIQNTDSEGTLDNLSPQNNKYDEHLKHKFSNINIKLPALQLPEDVLEYAKENQETNKDVTKINPYYNKNAAKYFKAKPQGNPENIYHHSNNPTDKTLNSEQAKPKNDKASDDYDFFASYINKPHEENNSGGASSDIEDGEDLYEQFVRERFGRKDSFKERSEKLQDKKVEHKPTAKNKVLFDNIQKAIKKAEAVQNEAEKSKDPQANYLWTLEYGEKL